jgi:hypothetical protein
VVHDPAGILGANILCAALIRFPWKRRQTGFVITHAGLLIVLAGSWFSLKYGDEGQVAMLEGETAATMTRTDAPVIRVRPLDPQAGTPTSEYAIPFRPGAFAWPAGRFEVLTGPQEPFKLAVKSFLPASAGKFLHEPAPGGDGVPMVRFGLSIQPPNALRPMDPFEKDFQDDLRWFTAGNRFGRRVKDLGGVRLVFQHVGKEDEARAIDDFLNPPRDAATEVARLHYADAQGQGPRLRVGHRREGPRRQGVGPAARQRPDGDLRRGRRDPRRARDAGRPDRRPGVPDRQVPGPQGGRAGARPLRLVDPDGPHPAALAGGGRRGPSPWSGSATSTRPTSSGRSGASSRCSAPRTAGCSIAP